jgi:predicted nucleic acid-binding protein
VAIVRTFADAGVLIWAARGQEPLSSTALQVLADADREFVVSDFLRLEVLPKAVYNKQQAEAAFYERFFAGAALSVPTSPQLMALAEQNAISYGLSAIDALHVATAQIAGATELHTTERPTSPLFRVSELKIVSIRPTV